MTDETSTPIEGLDLSVRTYNALHREGITTVGRLVAKTEDDLLSIRNFGHASMTEVREKLDVLGLLLADADEKQRARMAERAAHAAAHVAAVARVMRALPDEALYDLGRCQPTEWWLDWAVQRDNPDPRRP